MGTHVGGIGIFPGSFNPPHTDHLRTIRLALGCFDVLHMFVRYKEGTDLVDWETKRGWFDRINEEMDGRLVIHKMENQAVTGKTYTMEDFFTFIRNTVRSVGGPVRGFVFGDDYKNVLPAFQKEFPQMFFFKGSPPAIGSERISSTAIRQDLEGHKDWLPAYVYETLKQLYSAEEIDVTGCPVVGKGFGSTVYGLDEKTIVKVYKKGTPFGKVQKEYELSNSAFQSGVPCVRPYRLVRVDGAFGLVLERLSSSLGLAIHQEPGRMEAYVDQYVALAQKLHRTKAKDTVVSPIRDRWLSYADGLARWCSPDEVALVRDLVSRMPEANNYLHGDLHPGNIMFRGEEPVLIDMAALARGSYLCDLAVIYRGLVMGPESKEIARREESMGMSAQQIREVGDLFFMKYLGLENRNALKAIYSRLHVLYALSVVVMCGNERMKDAALARMLMDELLRKVVVPGKEDIMRIWQNGGLL
jgi:uncharacterized protein (TIGR02172 family)